MKTMHPGAERIHNCRNFLLPASLALFLVLTISGQAHAQHIITFDAPNSGTGAFQGTEATAINWEGAITGNVTDNGNGTHGFVRTPDGRFTNFDAPGADPVVGCTCPGSINDLGMITGNDVDTNSVSHGFVRAPDGQITTFDASEGPAAGAGQGTTPVGINDLWAIAGYYVDGNNVGHGFVRSPGGRITTFDDRQAGTGAYEGTYPASINIFGVIAGTITDANYVSHGFVRTPDGKITTFDVPAAVGGVAGTYSAFINDLGVIAGSYYDATTNVEYGYLRWPDGSFTKFAAPKTGTVQFTGTNLAAVNLEGATTGWIFEDDDKVAAFVRAADGNATTFDVPGQIIAPNPYLFGSAGAAINGAGVIAGRWHDVNYAAHGFLRTP